MSVPSPRKHQASASGIDPLPNSGGVDVSNSQDRHPWTIAHGFYATMGGFAVNSPETVHESSSVTLDKFWFVGANGLRLMTKLSPGDLPNLSTAEINSKSKANALAKTLLELNTSGHALCALLIYLLWWEKPFEVDYPTLLRSQTVQQFHAYKCMQLHSTVAVASIRRHVNICLQDDLEFERFSAEQRRIILQYPEVEADIITLSSYDDDNSDTMLTNTHNPVLWYDKILDGYIQDEHRKYSRVISEPEAEPKEDHTAGSITLKLGQTLPETILSFRPAFSRGGTGPDFEIFGPETPLLQRRFNKFTAYYLCLSKVTLSAQDVSRWKLASELIESCKAKHPQILNTRRLFRETVWDNKLLVNYCGDLPDVDLILKDFRILIGFSVAALVYGGLHALAWNAHFHSPVERLLWQTSSCVVMVGIPILAALVKINHIRGQYISGTTSTFLEKPLIVAIVVMLTAYALARGYLVVECFINLFNLPEEVYNIPQWSAYFPHIS
ncbi:MAG: hypothetical protein Q9170_004144 [Blastenia crenularia]